MAAMDPSISTQPAPTNTVTTSSSSSVPQTTPALLPVVIGAASDLPSPATYRLRSLLKIDLQVISFSILKYTFLGLFLASIGALIMLLGNQSSTNAAVVSIGVVGSLLFYPFLFLLSLLKPITIRVGSEPLLALHKFLIIIFFLSFPPVTGLIGSAVLLHYHVDLDGIDISKGCEVGFNGGWIFVGIVLGLIIFMGTISRFIMWVHETWTDRSYYASGSRESRGDDPEIIRVAELQNLPGRD